MRETRTLLAAALALAASTGIARAADWSDTWLGYRYGTGYYMPGGKGADMAEKKTRLNTVSLSHASGYKYGSNFFNVDFLMSDSNDPSGGTGSDGAQEIYAVYRHTLSLSKVSGDKIAFGPVRDVGITAGFNMGSKNNQIGARPRVLVLGPTLSFDVPGFFDVGLYASRETNHNGILCLPPNCSGNKVSFDTAYMLSAAWGIPLGPGSFKGFLTQTGKKGKDGFAAETGTETLLEAAYMLDLGALGVGPKGTWHAGVGYQYWKNKYGVVSDAFTTSKTTRTPQLQLEAHF
ncbi:hypothetical protein [Chitinimonas koreensis]|uniref:hypothetical protein n=1 Tax=Chitinimonas koreensis TaxID=356302 RepID=UPI0003F4D7EF|nr:hypothetical protein [Chitinimonas koreensis]QNM94809.1 outer envelope protein [Chitinimonas koreensis]